MQTATFFNRSHGNGFWKSNSIVTYKYIPVPRTTPWKWTYDVYGRELDSGGGESDASVVIKNGLMYRVKARTGELTGREQLVLPNQCRRVVIELAHSIPLAGHMGKNKTIGRILQRFYWPTVYKDVAEF